jgi:hypothetical protein
VEKKFVVALELWLLTSNIKKKVCDVLNYYFFFLKKYEKKKAHKMLSLMLDLRFKNLSLVP